MTRLSALFLGLALAVSSAPGALMAQPKGCPPGLAKKSPACVPPGLAKKRGGGGDWHDDDDDDDYIYDHYRRGDRLPSDRYVILEEGDRVVFEGREYVVVDTDHGTVLRRGDTWYRLPRYDDSQYVRMGDVILRVDRKTKALVELIRLTDLILS